MTYSLQPGQEPMDGFVYVLGCEPANWAPSPSLVKIGWAKDVDRRARALAIGSPLDLTVLRTYPGSRLMEAWLKVNFADRCERGEWFRMAAPEQLRRIDAAVDRYMHGDNRSDCVIAEPVPNPAALERWRNARGRRKTSL